MSNLIDQLVFVPVLLPLLGAGICLALGRSAAAQRIVSIITLVLVVAASVTLLIRSDMYGPQTYNVGGWDPELGISLVADRFSSLMLVVSTIVTLCVLLYSIGQGIVEFGRDTPLSVYYPTFLVLSAGVSNAFLSADLFNLFVGFEILLAASYVLITLGGTRERVRSGTIYIIVGLISSILFLVGVAAVYAATGTVNFAQLATRLQDLDPEVRIMLQLLLLITFAVKAAVFPLYAWLPDSYPTAPAPVTAVFAGLLTKVGIYAIVRTQTLMFPGDELRTLLLWAAILTMVVGILGAVAQSDIKRVLSFTLVSHIGYMLFGVAIASELSYTGAIFYIAHHITVQTTLFLVAGLVEYRSGTTNLERLGGLARAAPILSVMFFVPAMNLGGIPPFSGFLGKLALVEGAVAEDEGLAMLAVVAAIVTSLLTLYALAKIWARAFWQPAADPEFADEAEHQIALDEEAEFGRTQWGPVGGSLHGHATVSTKTQQASSWQSLQDDQRLPLGMAMPTLFLVVITVLLTAFAGPIMGYTERSAAELLEQTPYIEAVLNR